jgi:adenylate kinase family enzyme
MATPIARPLAFVALIGPPGVGKSTASGRLKATGQAGVFRLREFAQLSFSAGWIARERFLTNDHLGWFSDNTVEALIGEAFLRGRFPLCSLVVCENFPGTAEQVHILRRTAQRLGAPLSIIELNADDDILRVRVNNRWVCGTCEPNLDCRPHRPATPDLENTGRCRSCAQMLSRRESDDPKAFSRRLERYRNRLPGIRAAADSFGIPYRHIDTTNDDPADLLFLLRDFSPARLAGVNNGIDNVGATPTPTPAR